MARNHQEHVVVEQNDSEIGAFPQYDDGAIITMRIGGYLGALPYKQYPDMSAADLRALNVGRRYLAERTAQAALAKAQKENNVSDPAAFLRAYLGSWTAPTGDSAEFNTVAGLRAEIGRAYLKERFGLGDSVADKARIEKSLPGALDHPRHSVEIAKRLAAEFSRYVAPKSRERGQTTVDDSQVATLDLDAA